MVIIIFSKLHIMFNFVEIILQVSRWLAVGIV